MYGLSYLPIIPEPSQADQYLNPISAPLKKVSVKGTIRDTTAKVTLTQIYGNPTETAIEAVYQFPLHESVAVCGFEAEVDGRKIVGVVKEKQEAKKTYDEAKAKGKVAGLLSQWRDDVFQASIGNIPASAEIATHISFVTELGNDESDQLRLTIPTAIAPRYGYRPYETNTTDDTSTEMEISLDCFMSGGIASIQSPSHEIKVDVQEDHSHVTLASSTLLRADIIILIKSSNIDAPRCVVEKHPIDGTQAISLTFNPRFTLPALQSTELVFLIDRSGSMTGSKIREAANALELFIKSIPVNGKHYINIIGFGSSYKALFEKSQAYGPESFKTSIAYAKSLRADMGGTEIASAMQFVLDSRRKDIPTQVFLVTDGEVWNIDAVTSEIKKEVDAATDEAFVRVFTLGIGNQVSHQLIESVARAGRGFAAHVVEGERMVKKVIRMLKAGLGVVVEDVWVDWAVDVDVPTMTEEFEMVEAPRDDMDVDMETTSTSTTINLFSTDAPTEELVPEPLPNITTTIQQSPFQLPPLFPGARFTVYAITPSVPRQIVIRGKTSTGAVELTVPVPTDLIQGTMVHTLAAKKLVKDLEEGTGFIDALSKTHSATDSQLDKKHRHDKHMVAILGISLDKPIPFQRLDDLQKQEVVKIDVKYGISSRWTSWVFVQENDAVVEVAEMEPVQELARNLPARKSASALVSRFKLRARGRGRSAPATDVLRRRAEDVTALATRYVSSSADAIDVDDAISSTEDADESDQDMGYGDFEDSDDHVGLALEDTHENPKKRLRKSAGASEEESAPMTKDPDEMLHILLPTQTFQGSFTLSRQLAKLLSTTIKTLTDKLSALTIVDEESKILWATILSLAFLADKLGDLKEEWEMVAEKADDWINGCGKGAVEIEKLRVEAAKIVDGEL